MPIVVLSALDEEIALIVDSMEAPTSGAIGEWPVRYGRLGGRELAVATAGLGKVNTAALAAILWERHRPSVMILSGVAGAVDPSMGLGDLVVGECTVHHDAGVIGAEGLQRYQAGHIPFYNPTDEFGYRPSEDLLGAVRDLAETIRLTPVRGRRPEIRFGTILTGDQFLHDETTRDRLFTELGAQAVEMEGAALAQTARRLGADHIVIRSVSDLAGGNAIEDFDRFLPEVAANSARLVLGLIERLEEHDRDLTIGA